jgi:hypothetical protein
MASEEDNKSFLGFVIYVGVGIILYFLLKSFSRVKWIYYILILTGMAWGVGGLPASSVIARCGIDIKDKATRYVLIFIVTLGLLLYIYSTYEKGEGLRYE